MPLKFNPFTGNFDLVNASGGSGSAAWGAITGTLSNQSDLQAALDAKANQQITAGTYNFSGMTTAMPATAGVDDSAAVRAPFRLTQTAFRWRVVFKNYGDPFQITGVYVGKAADGLAPANYSFATAPTSAGSMAFPDTDYATPWQTTPIEGDKNYIISYGWTAPVGAILNMGPMGVYKSTPASTAASTNPTGGAEQLNGYLEARIEYEVAGAFPTMLTLGHSLNTNCIPTQPNGSVNAWPQLYAQKTGAIVSDISAYGSTADSFETAFALNRAGSIIPDVVSIWAMSNSINAGENFGQLVNHLIAIMQNCRAKWPGVQFIILTEPKRGDIPFGSAKDIVRNQWNNLLRDPSNVRSLGQIMIVDTDTVLSNTADDSLLFPSFAAADGNHQNYLGHLEVASAVQDGNPFPINKLYFDTKFSYVVGNLIPTKADITYVDSQDATKVDKVTLVNRIYGTSSMGNQTTYQLASGATAGSIALRGTDGVLKVGTPVDVADAATKAYVDTADTTKLSKTTSDTITDGVNYTLGTTTGTRFGTGTTQKIGFYNATPTAQHGGATDLGTVLSNLGLRAAGTAYPITTSGPITLTGVVQQSGIRVNVANRTGGYAPSTTDCTVFCNTSSAGFTVTLPTAVSAAGRIYIIKKTSTDGNTLTIATTSSQTIDGATTLTTNSTTQPSYMLQSDGANWWII